MSNNEDITLNSINIADYDFVDFGCSKGQSLLYGIMKFDGKNGIGIDISPNKVKQARKTIKSNEKLKNSTVICEDILKLPEYNLGKTFRFTTCIHFLEHVIGGIESVKEILESAIKISEEFIFIIQPNADKNVELFKQGFKTYYSDWTDHINLLTSFDFYRICKEFYVKNLIKDFIIFESIPISNSSNTAIHPLNSRINRHDYDSLIDPNKNKNIEFEGVYKDIGIWIILNDENPIQEYQDNIGEISIIYDSREDNLIKLTRKEPTISDCDYIDVGVGNAYSLKFGLNKFGGKHCLGIDKNPQTIKKTEKELNKRKLSFGGHKFLCEDILTLDTKKDDYYKKFRFATCMDVMEELNDKNEVEQSIEKLIDLSTDFVFISHGNCDYYDNLESLGFKTKYMLKNENKTRITSSDYITILNKLKNNNKIIDYKFYNRKIIPNSNSKLVTSISSNNEFVEFNEVYLHFDLFIVLKKNLSIENISKRIYNSQNEIKPYIHCPTIYLYDNPTNSDIPIPLHANIFDENKRLIESYVKFKINNLTVSKTRLSLKNNGVDEVIDGYNIHKDSIYTCVFEGQKERNIKGGQADGKIIFVKLEKTALVVEVETTIAGKNSKTKLLARVCEKEENNIPNGGEVLFNVNNIDIGSVTINNQGFATLNYVNNLDSGVYDIIATYIPSQDLESKYNKMSGGGTLFVHKEN